MVAPAWSVLLHGYDWAAVHCGTLRPAFSQAPRPKVARARGIVFLLAWRWIPDEKMKIQQIFVYR
jgi:hypothetical protein